jgi:hypothetical protein
MKKRNIIPFFFVIGLVILAAGIFLYTLRYSDVLPEAAWHIEGQVFDSKTNVMPGVNITVLATKKVTGFDNLFGTLPKEEHVNYTTDSNGRFVFNLLAVDVQLAFTKIGFKEISTNFQYIGDQFDSTNRNLQISLTGEPQ